MTDMTMEFARQMVAIAKAELDRMKPGSWETLHCQMQSDRRRDGCDCPSEHSEIVEVARHLAGNPFGTFTVAGGIGLVLA